MIFAVLFMMVDHHERFLVDGDSCSVQAPNQYQPKMKKDSSATKTSVAAIKALQHTAKETNASFLVDSYVSWQAKAVRVKALLRTATA